LATLVFDSSPLCAFARARRLPVLERLTTSHDRVTTRAVLDELAAGEDNYPDLAAVSSLPWLRVVPVDGLEELHALLKFTPFLGVSDRRDFGEATVLAWAVVHDGVAILDDGVGRRLAQEQGVKFRGTLGVVAEGIRGSPITLAEACALIDLLLAANAWLPCTGTTFPDWCRRNGVI